LIILGLSGSMFWIEFGWYLIDKNLVFSGLLKNGVFQ